MIISIYTGKALRLYFSLLIFLFPLQLFSQPGGGGGLQIKSFYNEQLTPIDLLNDHSIQVRTFLLKGNKIHQETFLYEKFLQENGKMRISRGHYGFGLPPTFDINEDSFTDRESNQRMYIIYGRDTMIIDFMGITGENAGGNSDYMDSLVVQKGYFKYYRSGKQGKAYDYNDYNANRQLIRNGLTPYTTSPLTQTGYIQYDPKVDLSFLKATKLPASYYLNRAAHYLQNNQLQEAFSDIQQGIDLNNGVKTCEIYYLLVTAFAKSGKYDKAIENISLALKCKRISWEEDWESEVENYRTRIELYTKNRQYEKALEDHKAIISISKNLPLAYIDLANYKMKYLKDYNGARNDLMITINTIPADHLNDRPQGWSEYADTYFTLAAAEYLARDKPAAFRHWLKAEEFGYSQSSSEAAVFHFDSIIRLNPGIPELYLSRALAHFKRGPYLGWGDDTKKVFQNAVNDINTAERLGMNDYRVNMYRASVLNQLKKHSEALQQIDIAIAKNNNDARCFLIRYNIRNELGQTKWGDNNDPDFSRYKMLLSTWRWERY